MGKKMLLLIVVIVMGLCFSASAYEGWEVVGLGVDYEPVTSVAWIGILKGSWYEMGYQYGERGAYDILFNTDMNWDASVKAYNGSVSEVKKRLLKYEEHLSLFSPQALQFLKGMADGAALQLDQSLFASESSNFDRVFNHNVSLALRARWSRENPPVGCNSFWVGEHATKDGKAIATFHSQGGWMGDGYHGRKHIYIAIPDDPKARIVWNFTSAGQLALGGVMANDAGVFHGLHAADDGRSPETMAYGVEPNVGRFHAMFYANSAEEATKIMIYGTAEYREKTGRKTLLGTRGVNLLFADASTAIMLEISARNHAIRRPGDLGEKGNGYIAQSNHNHLDFSFDENLVKSSQPMTKFAPEVQNSNSYYRFWSPMWQLYHNYGEIDLEMVLRDLTASHKIYNSSGEFLGEDPENAFCTHKYSNTGDPGGSHCPVVMVPETLEIYWVPMWPCRYTDRSWNYLNLNDYKVLRNAF